MADTRLGPVPEPGVDVSITGGTSPLTPDAIKAFHVLAKPTVAICNLACSYFFFLSKEMLYSGSRFKMADLLRRGRARRRPLTRRADSSGTGSRFDPPAGESGARTGDGAADPNNP